MSTARGTNGRPRVSDDTLLAQEFERHRPHLRAVASRMLGSTTQADDAVQEAWLRLSRTDSDAVESMGGWLTTVVGRISLDMLRTRKARGEKSTDERVLAAIASDDLEQDPAQEVELADLVGLAMLVVLDTLTPAERIAFVLHDMFGMSFSEIGAIAGRSPDAARQLASRARRRVRDAVPPPDAELAEQRRLVDAFLAAARAGDFKALLQVLDPNVVFRGPELDGHDIGRANRLPKYLPNCRGLRARQDTSRHGIRSQQIRAPRLIRNS